MMIETKSCYLFDFTYLFPGNKKRFMRLHFVVILIIVFLVGVFDLLTKVRIACGHIVLSFCFCLVNLKEGR